MKKLIEMEFEELWNSMKLSETSDYFKEIAKGFYTMGKIDGLSYVAEQVRTELEKAHGSDPNAAMLV